MLRDSFLIEVASGSLERAFVPNVISGITLYGDRKFEIMELFQMEVQPDPMAIGQSAIRAQACHCGAAIGVEYAEASHLVQGLV